jgi:hypothetical protein
MKLIYSEPNFDSLASMKGFQLPSFYLSRIDQDVKRIAKMIEDVTLNRIVGPLSGVARCYLDLTVHAVIGLYDGDVRSLLAQALHHHNAARSVMAVRFAKGAPRHSISTDELVQFCLLARFIGQTEIALKLEEELSQFLGDSVWMQSGHTFDMEFVAFGLALINSFRDTAISPPQIKQTSPLEVGRPIALSAIMGKLKVRHKEAKQCLVDDRDIEPSYGNSDHFGAILAIDLALFYRVTKARGLLQQDCDDNYFSVLDAIRVEQSNPSSLVAGVESMLSELS